MGYINSTTTVLGIKRLLLSGTFPTWNTSTYNRVIRPETLRFECRIGVECDQELIAAGHHGCNVCLAIANLHQQLPFVTKHAVKHLQIVLRTIGTGNDANVFQIELKGVGRFRLYYPLAGLVTRVILGIVGRIQEALMRRQKSSTF